MALLIVSSIENDTAQILSVHVEDLDAAVGAIGHIYVVLAVDADAMRQIELPRRAPAGSPGFHPIPVLIDFSDARIEVAVAYVHVIRGIPSDIRGPVEISVHVLGRSVAAAELDIV